VVKKGGKAYRGTAALGGFVVVVLVEVILVLTLL
jgi:hypothetical protein